MLSFYNKLHGVQLEYRSCWFCYVRVMEWKVFSTPIKDWTFKINIVWLAMPWAKLTAKKVLALVQWSNTWTAHTWQYVRSNNEYEIFKRSSWTSILHWIIPIPQVSIERWSFPYIWGFCLETILTVVFNFLERTCFSLVFILYLFKKRRGLVLLQQQCNNSWIHKQD